MNKNILLSKSKIKDHFLKCPRILWHELNFHKKEWDAKDNFLFDQGREVESIARSRFPNAVLQDKQANLDKLDFTEKFLVEHPNTELFEAAFYAKNTIIQFDILCPNPNKTYNAIEVKSSSSFKNDYHLDVLCQYWIATYAGLKIEKFELWYINKNKASDCESEDYFTKEDITEFVKANEKLFLTAHAGALETALNKDKMPQVKCSSNCEECPFRNTEQCKVEVTEQSVLALPNFRNKYKMFNLGIQNTLDLPEDLLNKVNPNVIKALKTNALVIDRENLMNELSQWIFPLNFFDFETLTLAIPILKNQRPYEQKVIQFSNHQLNSLNDLTMKHTSFLHTNTSCPDIPVIEAMLDTLLPTKGSIVAYNDSFEKTRINELIKYYPQYQKDLESIVNRFVDLMDIIKSCVYHPSFMGSYSLKVVSPVLLKEYGSYSDSLIKSGGEISSYYMKMINSNDVQEKKAISDSLEKYCKYDTLNLFLVLKYLLDQNVDLKQLVELNLGIKHD